MSHSNTSFTVEEIKDGDYQEVVRLFELLGPKYLCEPSDPRTRMVFDRYVAGDEKRGVVARVGGKVAGVFLFEIMPTMTKRFAQAHGEGMAVDKRFRGIGIGRSLIRAAVQQCDREHVTDFSIRASNPRVISLYRTLDDFSERGVCFFHTPAERN
jgi:ribosomal protein S18 acetylase RimI-like enzyme